MVIVLVATNINRELLLLAPVARISVSSAVIRNTSIDTTIDYDSNSIVKNVLLLLISIHKK